MLNYSHRFQSNNNYKRVRRKNQDWIKINKQLTEECLEDSCKQLSYNERLVLNFLLGLGNRFINIYPTQTTIAYEVDLSREEVNKILLRLERLGLVFSEYRHKRSCMYHLPTLFSQLSLRTKLSHLFSALRVFPLIWLTTLGIPFQSYSTTQDIDKFNKYIYTNRNCPLNNLRARARTDETEKKSMEAYISEEVKQLKELKLTPWGQIKLSGFPDQALLYGKNQLKYARSVKNLFNWFFTICHEYCRLNGLTVNWERVDFLKKTYGMPELAPMTYETKPYTGSEALSANPQYPKRPQKGDAHKPYSVPTSFKPTVPLLNREKEAEKFEIMKRNEQHAEHIKNFNRLMGYPEDHNPFSASPTPPSSPIGSPPTPTRSLRDILPYLLREE